MKYIYYSVKECEDRKSVRNVCIEGNNKMEICNRADCNAGHRKSAAQSVCVASERVYGAYRSGQRKSVGAYEDNLLSAASGRLSV